MSDPLANETPLPPPGFEDFLPAGGVVELFFRRAAALGSQPFLHRWEDSRWLAWSWSETAGRVAALTTGLRGLGVVPGDRVLLAAENRVEWHVTSLAIFAARAISVPLSVADSADHWGAIIADSAPSVCVVSAHQRAKLQAVLRTSGMSPTLVVLDEPTSADAVGWATLCGPATSWDSFPAVLDEVCCLMYTSGTGGAPKGVEQTHRNLLWNAITATQRLQAYGADRNRFLSFLPLSHTYEHTGGFITPLAGGAEIFVSRGVEHLARELVTARPTVLIVVPRFCEVMQQRIEAAVARQSKLKQRLFSTTLRIGAKRFSAANIGGARSSEQTTAPSDPDRQTTIFGRLWLATVGAKVCREIHTQFGGHLKCMLSAGSPLRDDTCVFFNSLGIALHQAYGQTETAPGVTMQEAGRLGPGNVGPPMHGISVRLADDGEILVRGPNVMRGYWRDADATARAVAGGWLHTGDIGRFSPDGSLAIVDRKKDFIKTAGGEMIAPQPVEVALQAQPGVAQAVVCGEGWPHLGALIVPDAATRERWRAGQIDAEHIRKSLQAAVDAVNRKFGPTQRVRRFAVIDEPFTPENGLATSTLKIRRRQVLQRHADAVARLGPAH